MKLRKIFCEGINGSILPYSSIEKFVYFITVLLMRMVIVFVVVAGLPKQTVNGVDLY